MPLITPVLPVSITGTETTGTVAAAALDVVRGTVVGAGTVGVVLVVALVVGLALLFRRRARSAVPPGASRLAPSNAALGIDELTLRAGATLVRADDAVESAENEVGFAVAQFGVERTAPFAEAVATARAQIAEAFRLKQQLDDAYPDTDQQRRDWTKRVIALGESAEALIGEQNRQFTALRRSEADAPTRLQALRSGLEETRAQLTASSVTLQRLARRYDLALISEISGNVDAAEQALASATTRVEQLAAHIQPGGVSAVSGDLDDAAGLVHTARRLLAAIDTTAASLSQAESALADLVAATRTDLMEARVMRDDAPDAETGARILRAIDEVEFVLGAANPLAAHSPVLINPAPINPVHDLARLGSAVSALDTALAGARNQQQRLTHARTALVGALVGARSEIAVAKGYMAQNSAGVDARTRLAEAERQLLLAESESDPVDALDAARRSATAARDADALARYRG